jgi:hypothetical protein
MDLAQTAPETVILAEDEASLYLQATTMAVWAPRGQTPLVRVHPNRDKVSFWVTQPANWARGRYSGTNHEWRSNRPASG